MDPQLLEIIADLDTFTRSQLLAFNKDLQKILKAHSRGDEIVDTDSLFKKLAVASATFGGAFAVGLLLKNTIAARKSISADNDRIIKAIIGAGGDPKKVKPWFNNNAESAVTKIAEAFPTRRFPGTRIGTGQRIKNIQEGSEKVVRNIIELGIKNKMSSFEIAKEIEQYVIPNENGRRVAPWTISRRRFGRPTSYIPKGIPAGSVEYNAMRIARAETAATYQQAPYVANHGKWYVEGFIWVLSRSHPKRDTCDDYANHDEGIGKGIWRIIPKLPHPHCLCPTQTKVIDGKEMVEWLNRLKWS